MNAGVDLELLSPAGNFECLRAGVANGADAVYLGGKNFSARASADNFTVAELENAVDYCHSRGVKLYLTVNTLIKDKEFSNALKLLEQAYVLGADAVIIQDLGLAAKARDMFPDIKFHASTQMTAGSVNDCLFLRELGFDRIILSRELSLKQVKLISKSVEIETEIFVHGSLCVCYSGRCLMSSMLGGRSGNRGCCAQPCRMKYSLICEDAQSENVITDGYLLSTRDIMTPFRLTDVAETGVRSIKIEGRMKTPEYVAAVTAMYRAAIDGKEFSKAEAERVFNRGGFHSGGYFGDHSGTQMMSIKTPKSTGQLIGTVEYYDSKSENCTIKLIDNVIPGDGIEIWTRSEPHFGTGVSKSVDSGGRLYIKANGSIAQDDKVYRSYDKALNDRLAGTVNDSRKLRISGFIEAKIGEALKLTLSYMGVSVTGIGELVQKSDKRPVTHDELIGRMSKTGGTSYIIDFNDQSDIDDNIFIGVSAINELRRKTLEEFSLKLLSSFKRTFNTPEPIKNMLVQFSDSGKPAIPVITVLTRTLEQTKMLIRECNNDRLKRIIVEYSAFSLSNIAREIIYLQNESAKKGICIFLALPHIDDDTSPEMNDLVQECVKHADGLLVRTFGQLNSMTGKSISIILDSTFNVLNRLTKDYLSYFDNIDKITLSPELNITELRALADVNCEVLAYGAALLMYTRQCPIGLYKHEKSASKFCSGRFNDNAYYLKDTKGFGFPIITDCMSCHAMIYNSRITNMLPKINDIISLGVGSIRLDFINETPEEAAMITKRFSDSLTNRRLEAGCAERKSSTSDDENRYTYGHFYRGTE